MYALKRDKCQWHRKHDVGPNIADNSDLDLYTLRCILLGYTHTEWQTHMHTQTQNGEEKHTLIIWSDKSPSDEQGAFVDNTTLMLNSMSELIRLDLNLLFHNKKDIFRRMPRMCVWCVCGCLCAPGHLFGCGCVRREGRMFIYIDLSINYRMRREKGKKNNKLQKQLPNNTYWFQLKGQHSLHYAMTHRARGCVACEWVPVWVYTCWERMHMCVCVCASVLRENLY